MFVPEVYGTTLNGLFRASIYNASGMKSVRMNITVTEARAGKIATIQTGVFTIAPGNNIIPSGVARTASLAMAQNATANFIRRNQYFPQGDYEYSFNIYSASSSEEIIIDQTFNHEITPPAPLDLIEPYDKDDICEKRPLLTWQPSIPKMDGLLYQVMLVEIKDKQNAVEALNYNLPIVNQKGIVANLLVYPPNSKELVAGKKYAWQVSAYRDQTIINRSDVWSFEVNCQDTVSAVIPTDYGYRDIENLVKGNFYIAEGFIRFSMINSYQEQKLRFNIVCTTDPKSKIRSLPTIKLKKGQNKINIDLSRNFSFKEGYSYVMTAYLPDGTPKSLRFIYKNIE
ncbi:DUF928 domain-containing protein [Pedobacter riviphilus]|uniref:DUF928 domain-containing protein n=1 Tax=Pedobacter riviphilus TaxID=2766984 RepID=A0ABX6TPV2_9SPHI|nr:DUF928 domain-containing protein [Pedobacter riviphilus]QNR87025.1 DUF928 domain-containing protein [Pedobacter riviphilus]